MTSACRETVLVSTPLLKKLVREQPDAWQVLMFIPNHKKWSSTKKRQESQCKLEKGRGYQNYHRCLAKGLQSVQEVMDNGGFNTYMLMGDEIHYIRIIPVVSVLIGDGKNGDTLVLHFGGKNCLGHVLRLCMTSFGCLSDTARLYPLIKASLLKSLYIKSMDQSLTSNSQQQKVFRSALWDMSTHWVMMPSFAFTMVPIHSVLPSQQPLS
jgi:hypothetical protein